MHLQWDRHCGLQQNNVLEQDDISNEVRLQKEIDIITRQVTKLF